MRYDELDIAEKLERASRIERGDLDPTEVKAMSLTCADAAEAAQELRALRNALADQGRPYVGEETSALVMYFETREGAEGFAAAIDEARPGMVQKSVHT